MLLHLHRFLLLSALSSLWIKGSEARHLSEGGHGDDPPESLASNRGRRRREGGSLEQEPDGQVGTGVRIRRRRRDDRRPPADSSPLLLQHDTQGSRLQHLTAEWEKEAEHFTADAGKYSDNDKVTPEKDAAQTTVSQTAGSSPTELKHNRKATAQSESHLSPQHAQPPKLPKKTALALKTIVEMHQDGEDSLPSPFSPQIQHPLNTATAQEDEHAKAPETTNTVTNNEDDTMEDAKMDTVDDNSFYDTLSQTHHGNMNRQETNPATDEKKSPTVTKADAVNTMVPDTAVYIPFTERLSSPKSEVKLEHTKQVGQKQGQNERAAGERLRRQSGDDDDSNDDGEEDFDDAEAQDEDDADDTDTNYKLDPEGKEADADAQLTELMKEDVPIPTGGKGIQILTATDQREIDQMSHLVADLVMNNDRNSLSLGNQLTIVGNDPDTEADEEEEYEHARKGRHPRHTSSPNSERNINKNANKMTENDGDSLDTKVDTEDYIAEDRGSKNSMFFQDGPTRNDEPSDEDDHHNLQFSSQRNLAQHIQDFADDSGMGYDKGKLIIKNYEDKKYRSFGIDDGGLSKEIGQEIKRSAGIVAAIRRLKDQLLNAYKQGTTSIPDIRGKQLENNGSSVGLNTPEIDPLAIIVHDMKSFTLRNEDEIQDKQTDMERKMLNVMKAVKNKTSKHNTLTKAMPFSHLNDSTKGNKSDSHNADRISIEQQKSENNREFNKRNKMMKTKPLLRNNEKNNDDQLYAELSTGQIADKDQKAPESIKSLNLTDTSDADNSQGNTNNERKDYKDISNTLHKVKEIKMSDRKRNRNSESIRTFENKHISELRTEVNKTGAMMAKEQKSVNHPREAMGYDDSYRLTPMLAGHVTDFNYQSLNTTTKSKVRPQFIDFVDKASHTKEDTARTHVHPSTEPINENAHLLNFGTNDTNYTNSSSKYGDYNYERKSNTINLQTHTPPSYQKISSNYKFPIKMQNVVIGQYNPKQNTESKASEIEKDTKADQENITLRNKENDKYQPNPIKIKESTFEQTYDTQSPGSRIISTHIKSKQETKPKILIPVNRRKYYFDKQDTDKTKEYKQNAEMEMQNKSMYSRKDQQHRMLKRNTRRKRKQHIQKENLHKNNPQKSGTKSDEGQHKLTNDELLHTLSNIKEQMASLEKSLSQKTGKLDRLDGKELDESKPGEKVNEEENIMETELKQTTQIEKKNKKSRPTKPKKDGVISDKPRQRHTFSKTKLKQSKKVKPKQKNESQRLRDKLKQIKHEGTEYAALSKPTKGKQDHDSHHKHANKLVSTKKKSKRIRAKHKNKNQLRPRKNGKDASNKDEETVTMEETIVEKEGRPKNDDKNQDSSAAERGLFKDDDNTDQDRAEEQNEPGPNKKAAPDKDGELVEEKKIITKKTPQGTEKITIVEEKGSKLDEDVGKREEENDDNNNEPRGTEESEENEGDAESDQNRAELWPKKKATPRGNRKSTSNKDEEGETIVEEKRIIKGMDVADRDPILDDIVEKIEKIQITNNVKEKNQDLAAKAESERYPEDKNADQDRADDENQPEPRAGRKNKDDEVVEEKIVTKKKPHATTKIKTIVERDPETDDLVEKREEIKTVDKFYKQDGTEESDDDDDDDDSD